MVSEHVRRKNHKVMSPGVRLSTMTGSREEERRKLADIINHWNANRLDLFEISRPTELICSSTCHSEPLASP
ncbi:hypothetical protein F7725_019917 [Dissostichus mawsoni]|uniref:Uncharacterized protein n=1 Tax=Dissostichus mawsoni TaxID=36200 RepID=A0A7J5YPK0_DISMA|nr:hypothetical protein F7725_019917 [Dissostichus mawsoni]